MTEYYKALRPDGTDFATGATKPRKGRWMPRIEGELVICERGYHVSTEVAETLIGGSWPCKLAKVEIPEGEWQQEKYKLVVPTYRVVEWLPAWQALGPNGEVVAALIERAKNLTPSEIERLAAARVAAVVAAVVAAQTAAVVAARYAAVVAAQMAAWVAARYAAGVAARYAAGVAAVALVVRDLISEEHFNTLYGPWREVLGE